MQVRFAFSSHVFTAPLSDTVSARDFATMLPLDLKVTDFSDNEKIAYLPRKLNVDGNVPYTDAALLLRAMGQHHFLLREI